MEQLSPAEKHYMALKEAQRRYYYKNRQTISEQRKKKYRELNPVPKPRGPKPKSKVVEGVQEVATDGGVCVEC